MDTVKILDFLSSITHQIFVMNSSTSFEYVEDLLETILTANYCSDNINLGVVYVKKNTESCCLLVDGKRRILAFTLLLKAIADINDEKFSDKNNLSQYIYDRYLKSSKSVKLSLFSFEKTVFDKLINQEPLSYNEKQTEIYRTLQLFKEDILRLDFRLEDFYALLNRVVINIVYVDEDCNTGNLFWLLNKDSRKLNQLLLIKSYLAELGYSKLVDDLFATFAYKEEAFDSFFQAYLSPKFNTLIKDSNRVYDYFVKYIDMIRKYQSLEDISKGILKTAKIYQKMYNAEFMDSELRNMFIQIIANNGRDTFSYLLELCEDYENKYLSKESLLQVGTIINTYLSERNKKSSTINENIDFSKMVKELNQVVYDEQSK